MESVLLELGILLYGIFQLLVAFIALILAVKWEKYEFQAGLSFLFLYSVIEIIDVYFFTVRNEIYLDVAHYGFILLAIIFFIIGMHRTGAQNMASGIRPRKTEGKPSVRKESVISLLKKILIILSKEMNYFYLPQ
jgi:hypothetical protein